MYLKPTKVRKEVVKPLSWAFRELSQVLSRLPLTRVSPNKKASVRNLPKQTKTTRLQPKCCRSDRFHVDKSTSVDLCPASLFGDTLVLNSQECFQSVFNDTFNLNLAPGSAEDVLKLLPMCDSLWSSYLLSLGSLIADCVQLPPIKLQQELGTCNARSSSARAGNVLTSLHVSYTLTDNSIYF